MMTLIRHIRIKQKLAISPVLIVLAALALGVLAWRMTAAQDVALDVLYHEGFAKKQLGNDLAVALMSIDGGLYRSITWQNAGADDKTVKGSIAATATLMDGIPARLDAIDKSLGAADGERARLAELRAAALAYVAKSRDVLDMLDGDPVMAVTLLRQAERLYAKVDQSVAAWSEMQKQSNDTLFEQTRSNSHHSLVAFFLIMGAAFGTATLIVLVVGHGISGGIAKMTQAMTRLASGDTDVAIPASDNHDEIGDMAHAVQVFKDNAIEADHLRQAQGDARERSEREKAAARQAMANDFESTVEAKLAELDGATGGIAKTAHSMVTRSEHSGGRSLDVGEAAVIATDRAAMASEATRQMAQAVNEIASQVGHSTRISQQAVDSVNHTVAQMDGLSASVQAIGEIVRMINDVATQTNLLALNATIEAARAGDAGKGFAVVAHEVKDLANQTARATDEIARKVTEVQDSARTMAASITGVVETIRSLDEVASAIAGAVQQQEASTRDIAGNIDEVARQTATVSEGVRELAKASTQACAGTVRVIWSATGLVTVVQALKGEAERFAARVRQ